MSLGRIQTTALASLPSLNIPAQTFHENTYIHTHTHMRAHVHGCTHKKVCAKAHTQTCKFKQERTCARAHTHTHTHTQRRINRKLSHLGSPNVASAGPKALSEGAHHDVNIPRVEAEVVNHPSAVRPHGPHAVSLIQVQVELVLLLQPQDLRQSHD